MRMDTDDFVLQLKGHLSEDCAALCALAALDSAREKELFKLHCLVLYFSKLWTAKSSMWSVEYSRN